MSDYRELLIGCGAKRVKDLSLPTAMEIALAIAQMDYRPAKGEPRPGVEFRNLFTLDNNPDHKPDYLCDLRKTPPWTALVGEFEAVNILEGSENKGKAYRQRFVGRYSSTMEEGILGDNTFDEIHAYEVLEHIGQQGDYITFFAQFSEFWRILKPGGLFFATCPSVTSRWAWGDPSHTRVIQPETLVFLSQKEYTKQVGVTAMSDFRHIYTADFDVLMSHDDGEIHRFVMRAIK
jgi:hypothetical protein